MFFVIKHIFEKKMFSYSFKKRKEKYQYYSDIENKGKNDIEKQGSMFQCQQIFKTLSQ